MKEAQQTMERLTTILAIFQHPLFKKTAFEFEKRITPLTPVIKRRVREYLHLKRLDAEDQKIHDSQFIYCNPILISVAFWAVWNGYGTYGRMYLPFSTCLLAFNLIHSIGFSIFNSDMIKNQEIMLKEILKLFGIDTTIMSICSNALLFSLSMESFFMLPPISFLWFTLLCIGTLYFNNGIFCHILRFLIKEMFNENFNPTKCSPPVPENYSALYAIAPFLS